MRKGVVMIMTLALIMVLTLVVLRSTTVSENYLNDMSKSIYTTQFNRTFLDMTQIVQSSTSSIKNAKMFKIALKIPLVFSDEESELEGVLRLKSAAGKFNINKLLYSTTVKDEETGKDKEVEKINQTFYDLIYSVLREYEVRDGLFLLSLILDTIDKDSDERAFGSELAYKDGASINDGGITNKKALYKVLDFYAKSQNDGSVYNIPWDKFISYDTDKTDYNYIIPKIKAILEQDYGINTPYDDTLVENDEDLSLTSEQKVVFKNLNIKYYVPILTCNFEFNYLKQSMNIVFNYNLSTKRINDIETVF